MGDKNLKASQIPPKVAIISKELQIKIMLFRKDKKISLMIMINYFLVEMYGFLRIFHSCISLNI